MSRTATDRWICGWIAAIPNMTGINQCCDHCVVHVSGLLHSGLPLVRNGVTDPVIAFVRPVPSETRSPPYKPPQV
jgi:hypothetical protein